jgi:FKBP-type peptidyl-prolyl cis-trans isomerase FkpA
VVKKLSWLLALSMLALISCFKEPEIPCTKEVDSSNWTLLNQTQLQAEVKAIDDYLVAKGIATATKDVSGLRYEITATGTGEGPCLEQLVAVRYQGIIMSTGTVFESQLEPISLYLNEAIVGWQILFLKLGKGARANLYVPAGLAYGSNVHPSVPANSNLIFRIELLDFE